MTLRLFWLGLLMSCLCLSTFAAGRISGGGEDTLLVLTQGPHHLIETEYTFAPGTKVYFRLLGGEELREGRILALRPGAMTLEEKAGGPLEVPFDQIEHLSHRPSVHWGNWVGVGTTGLLGLLLTVGIILAALSPPWPDTVSLGNVIFAFLLIMYYVALLALLPIAFGLVAMAFTWAWMMGAIGQDRLAETHRALRWELMTREQWRTLRRARRRQKRKAK